MPFTEESKIVINNLFDLKGYNGEHLVRQFPNKGWNVGLVCQLLQKLRVTGWVDRCLAAADDAVPAQLITLILLTN